jgi:hypothetical protein
VTVHTDTIVIVRRPPGPPAEDPDGDGRDPFGDPLPDVPDQRIPIAGCVITQRRVGITETERDRDITSTERIVHVPAGTDVRASDEAELPGESGRWRVVGDPGHRRPQVFTGHRFRTRVVLRRVEG